jgi:hypothetical protein
VGSTVAEHPTWVDTGLIGDDSGQMVDRFEVDDDRHPEMVVILAGTNDGYPDWALCSGLGQFCLRAETSIRLRLRSYSADRSLKM